MKWRTRAETAEAKLAETQALLDDLTNVELIQGLRHRVDAAEAALAVCEAARRKDATTVEKTRTQV
jgi:hypothetical protein